MSEERNFFCTRDGAHKFWCVLVEGNTQTVCWGRIGTAGQTLRREFSDSNEAQKATTALIAQKTAKGYVEASREEITALAPPAVVRPRKSGEREPSEFQLLLPFDELSGAPVSMPPRALAASVSETPLSLFD